jgi:hypothetical protein
MNREIFHVGTDLSPEEIVDLDKRRMEKLYDAGIDEREVIGKARDNLNVWNTYFNENMVRGKEDMNFLLRDQWTSVDRAEFNRLFKPCMTFNKLYDATKKIAGEQRKNKPDLIVRSLTGKATQEQIDLRADLVRTISYQSQNDLVYQSAFRNALYSGYGAFQINLEYETPMSFNQKIMFNMIPDPTRCTFDATALKPHKGDGNYCSRNYVFSKEEFAATYPYITNPVSYNDPRTLLDFQWETRDTIVVCDYYQKEWFSTMAYKLSNGQFVSMEQWEEMQISFAKQREMMKDSPVVREMLEREIPHIVMERQTQDYKIMHYRLTKDCIIDFSEWPSKQLPIIFVDGDSCFIEGRQYTRSFIHEAKDAQRFINFVGSEIAAEIKNRRREQWIGTPDNIIGNEQMWRNPELQNGILIAKADQKTGAMPQKMPAWEISQGLLQQFERGTMDMKEIMGFHEELQGAETNAQSGVAIKNRMRAGSMSAYVYFDNLNQAIEQAGRVVLDLLPVVYGGDERHVVISKPDGKTQSKILNQKQPDGTISNSMEAGEYDIEIDTGPSFAVQKEASMELLMQLVNINPAVFPLVADLLAKNLDISFMSQIADRFKTLVPPEILAKEEGQPPPPPKPDPQQQMMQQEMQMKQAELQIKQQQLQERGGKLQLDQQSHELDKAKLMMELQKMQHELESTSAETDLGKAKLLVELKKIQAEVHGGHLDRELEHKKVALDHHAKMTGHQIDHHHKTEDREVAKEQANKPQPEAKA